MSAGWSEADRNLDSPDDSVVMQGLQSLTHEGSDLDDKGLQAVLPKCLDKLQHHDIAIRATAMMTILSILHDEKLALDKHVTMIAKKLQQPNLVDLKAGIENKTHHAMLHKSLCAAVVQLQMWYPDKLMPHFKAIGQYVISCTGHRNHDISSAACGYWAKLRLPPVPSNLMELWVPVILSKLGKLVPSLLGCMVYHEKHAEFLQKLTNGDKVPDDMATYTNRRNYAALGFENLCQIFPSEMSTVFKPLLEKWLHSDKWQETEAAILALGALTQAAGTPKELRDIYPTLIPRLLELYEHKHPLVRSIVCFTMQHFLNIRMKGVKDPFMKMLKHTLVLLRDELCEVQEMALQSLAAILAYAEHDISPQLRKIIDTLVKCNGSIKGKGRYSYYECIGHIFGRASGVMDEADAKQLLKPLMTQWDTLDWAALSNDSSSEVIISLCQALCVVAMYHGPGFASYNEIIFSSTIPYIERIAAGTNGHRLEKESTMKHMVASLDLLSAMFEGQGKNLSSMVHKHKMEQAVVHLLQCDDVHEKVHQSALASLGNLCQHCYDTVKPHFQEVVDILAKDLDSHTTVVQNNAVWALAQLTNNHNDSHNDKLLRFTSKLRGIMLQAPLDNGVAINTALALTNLARNWPHELAKIIIKDDVFQPLCFLLQNEFPRDLEKVAIFSNFCAIVLPCVKTVRKENWVQFCIAAATLDCNDDHLTQSLRSVLRDVRTHLGNSGWNKLSQAMGSQLAYSLRKRYKLY